MFKLVKGDYTPKYHVPSEDVLNELKKHMLADGFDFVLDLYNSSGVYFYDARNGQRYLDFFTCFASLPIGMNHPKMIDQDYIEYLGKISLNKPSNSDIYTESMATFVNTFFKVADIDAFKYIFMISDGALAVCNALKTSFDWKVRKNFSKGYTYEKGHQIMHFKEAFHGRAGYTLSLTNTDPKKTDYYPKFNWPRIDNPYLIFPDDLDNEARIIEKERLAIEQMKQSFVDNKDEIAAIIIEPIQGEGGDRHFRPEFMQKLRDITLENDCLLIFDEVQTGVGITGKWWAHQHTGVVPDIMTFGKKMQICGILVGERIDEVPDNVFHTSSRINSTWGGNLIDMVRSTRYLEIIEEDNLVQNSANMGIYLINELNSLQSGFPDIICNIRGKGLFCAFDLPDQALRNALKDRCFEKGLFILPSGEKSIRFRPALNINEGEISEGMRIIESALKSLI